MQIFNLTTVLAVLKGLINRGQVEHYSLPNAGPTISIEKGRTESVTMTIPSLNCGHFDVSFP